MAILALVFAFVFAPLGIVFGIIGRTQTRKRGEGGRGLATAGLILGIVFTLLEILFIALIIVVAVNATPTVSQAKVESEISTKLESTSGTTPDSVQCPGELKGKEGEVLTCTTTVSGVRGQVDVAVTSVSGSTIRYNVQPNRDAAPEVLQSYVESQLSNQLEAKARQKPDSVQCPGDLLGKVGETMTCTASVDGDSAPIEVKVAKVEGLKVAFGFTVK